MVIYCEIILTIHYIDSFKIKSYSFQKNKPVVVLTSVVAVEVVITDVVATTVVVTTFGFSVVSVVLITETSPCSFPF